MVPTSDLESLNDRAELAEWLAADPALHLYEIGDLDAFSWPDTSWFGQRDANGGISAVAMIYAGFNPPTLLAFEGRKTDAARELVAGLSPHLPPRFQAHLSPHLTECVNARWHCVAHVPHLKMVLTDRTRLDAFPTEAQRLAPEHLTELTAFYARSYPGNWFDPRMLETGCYVGIRRDGHIVCAAGVHVYSATYRVAALGNIATDPEDRGQGLAQQATAPLCRSLLATVDTIGLNVRAANAPAIACYQKLGFEEAAEFDAATFTSSHETSA